MSRFNCDISFFSLSPVFFQIVGEMPQCFVSNCSNYYGKTRGKVKVMYHIFPTKSELVAKWSVLCGYKKDFRPPIYARVCSEHFSNNCYQRDLQHELLGLPLRKKLKPDAVPNRNLPNQINTIQKKIKPVHVVNKKMTQSSSISIISGNKPNNHIIPKCQKTGKTAKNYLEYFKNRNNTTPKSKIKTGLNKSNSIIRISIDNLCRNKSPSRRYSDPLKETNKIENKLTTEVTIERVKKINEKVKTEPVRRFSKEITIQPVFKKESQKTLNAVKIDEQLRNEFKISNNPDEISEKSDMSVDNKTCEKKSNKLLWENKFRRERMPMRSSIRIAKKKSIESLSESFTLKVNSKRGDLDCNKPERFSDKLKFMAMLQLRYLRNKTELDQVLSEAPGIIPLDSNKR